MKTLLMVMLCFLVIATALKDSPAQSSQVWLVALIVIVFCENQERRK